MTHPPNAMPEELQRAHYIMQIVKLEKLNAELLAALKAIDAWNIKNSMYSGAWVPEFLIGPAREAIARVEGRDYEEGSSFFVPPPQNMKENQ